MQKLQTRTAWNKGLKGYNKSYPRTKEWCERISMAKMGHTVSVEAREKISVAFKGKPQLWNRGKNHYNWNGGITPEYNQIRASIEYKEWRASVFARDKYQCVLCGHKSKGTRPPDIHADHIKPFSLFPELRFDVNNGRTLCEPCHRKTDTWGFKIKNYKVETV